MKALALSVALVSMAGIITMTDAAPPIVKMVDQKEQPEPDPFSDRKYAEVRTSVSEAPTGRFMAGANQSQVPNTQEMKLEKRLEDLERKLDHVLKELQDLKSILKR